MTTDRSMTVTLIDNYDSFTYNLFHYLGELGAQVRFVRNDELTADEALALKPEGIVLSPGPCTPNEAGICLEVIEKANGHMPILGVCLGHQAIGQVYGGKIVRAPRSHAWQALRVASHRQVRVPRPEQRFHGHALSLPHHRARQHAGRSGSHRRPPRTA